MITIYDGNTWRQNEIDAILNDKDVWSFPLEEIDYLLQEHTYERFVLINNRLYELNR